MPDERAVGRRLLAALAVVAVGRDRRRSSCSCREHGRAAADRRHGPADRDPHRARDHRTLASIAVTPGQHVRKGDLLAVLDNPELDRSVGEAKAAARSAKAERDRIYSGVRAEEVAIAADRPSRRPRPTSCWPSSRMPAPPRWRRRDFASRQELDESTASLAKAQADLDLKQRPAAAASAGPTAEERALADARVALAEATVADLQASSTRPG